MIGTCSKCGHEGEVVNGIGGKGTYCIKCHDKFVKGQEKKTERRKLDLNKCFAYTNEKDFVKKKRKAEISAKYAKQKIFKNHIFDRKKMWEENFKNDFPSYRSFISWCRSWGIKTDDEVAVRKGIDELDAKLKTYI